MQHHKGVIHRDMKSENVFFATSTQIKIGDFGFSTHNSGNLLNTFCGSPPYAAPELFSEESYYGHLVDIWAIGVTLYFMVSAKMPFKGDTIPQMRITIQEGKYNPLVNLSEPCQSLIAGILTVDPSSRWTLDDIERCVWVKGDTGAQISHTSINELTIRISSDNTFTGAASPSGQSVDLEVLSRLDRLGVPTVDQCVFTGEPRNPLAGTYRILLHRKLINNTATSGQSEESQANKTLSDKNELSKETADTSKVTPRPTQTLKSKFCVIL